MPFFIMSSTMDNSLINFRCSWIEVDHKLYLSMSKVNGKPLRVGSVSFLLKVKNGYEGVP